MPDASRRQIHKDRLRLQNPYAHVHGEGELRALSPEVQEEMDLPITLSAAELRGGKQLDSEFSKEEIEEIASRHQIALWKNKNKIWKRGDSKTPIEILDPFMALASIGYTCKETESLGQFSDGQGKFEVAAIIESDDQHVDISKQFPATVRKFTAAHELGHALLHNSDGLHRDRPLNGANSISQRNRKEKDADKFATFF